MERALAERFETVADGIASLSFGGAVGVSVYHLLASASVQPALGAYAAAAFVFAYWTSRSLLGLVERRSPIAPIGVETLCDALSANDDPPVVVRLFDQVEAAAPGPSTDGLGRLANGFSPAAPPDASNSLHEALNQLRQSLASRR